MCLVTKSLKYNKEKIAGNLLAMIKSIISSDVTDTEDDNLRLQMKTIEEKRANLIDLYISGDLTRDEFAAERAKCENEISELLSVIDNTDKQKETLSQQQKLVDEMTKTVNELVNGVEYDDEFYKEILDKIVVNDKDHMDVYLNLLSFKWSYTAAKEKIDTP